MNNKILYTILFVMFCAIIFLFVDRQNLKNKSLENFEDNDLLEAITNLGRVSKSLLDNDLLTIPGNVNMNGDVIIHGKLTVLEGADIGNAHVGSNGDKAQFKHKDNHDSDGYQQGPSGHDLHEILHLP